MLALIAGLTAAKVGQNTPESRIVPGGRWLGPDRNFVAREGAIHLAARAYPARADDPPIAYVNFTVWWAEGDWQVACTARTPQPGTSDQYICDWDPASRAIPNGVIKVSFDVYDARGNHNNAPNGIHEGIVQR